MKTPPPDFELSGKKIIQLLTEEQARLMKSTCAIITSSKNGETYYHNPFYYRYIGDHTFEVLKKCQVPEDVKEIIDNEKP